MKDTKNIDPREVLCRLDEFLDDDELPTELSSDEEARAICAAMGIDIAAATARLMALVDAQEAGLLGRKEEAPPQSLLRVRRPRVTGVRHRARR